MAAATRRTGISRRTTKESSGFALVFFAALGLAGCGGSSGAATVEKALARQRNAQGVRCAQTGRFTYQGKRVPLYRCSFVEEVGANAMRAKSTCFVYVDRTVIQVGARC